MLTLRTLTMKSVLSWIFYAGGLFSLLAALGLAFVGRKALGFVYGHLGIGFGFALMCACVGFLLANDPPPLQLALVTLIGAGGYLLFFFGRRRARDEKRFLDAVSSAQTKQIKGKP
jgi:hypothetical protein